MPGKPIIGVPPLDLNGLNYPPGSYFGLDQFLAIVPEEHSGVGKDGTMLDELAHCPVDAVAGKNGEHASRLLVGESGRDATLIARNAFRAHVSRPGADPATAARQALNAALQPPRRQR